MYDFDMLIFIFIFENSIIYVAVVLLSLSNGCEFNLNADWNLIAGESFKISDL